MKSAASTRTLQRARALMERCLRPGRAASLSIEFPLIFEERFGGRIIAYEEKGDVRSACALLVRDLIVGGSRLRVGLLGSVATEMSWRGKGLAARVLDEAEAVLAREGCALSILWADDPQFYAGRGYHKVGWEVDCVVPAQTLAALTTQATIRAHAPDDSTALQRLYVQHGARVDRSPAETAALLACPGMATLVLQRERDIVAYACMGRGADFPNTIHEWGGAVEDVLAIAGEHARRALRAGHEGQMALIAPPSATQLRERLSALGAQVQDGVLGMAKVIDAQGLAELFDRFGGGLRAVRDSAQANGAALVVSGPGGTRALSDEAALAVVLPERGERKAIALLEQQLCARAPQLPITPFIWGLDSI